MPEHQVNRFLKPLFYSCACALTAGLAFSAKKKLEVPEIDTYKEYFRTDKAAQKVDAVTVNYFGVTSLLISDGQTNLLIDGFFTRPTNQLQLFLGKISSDRQLIKEALDTVGAESIDAVLVFHSHYDHVMDSPEVAGLTGAMLLGSQSTANVGRGAGLPEDKIKVVTVDEPMKFGEFTVTFIQSKHIRLPWPLEVAGLMGRIDTPLSQPTSMFNYREGGTYAILIEHPLGSCMLHSGDFNSGELEGYQADTIFLCAAGLEGYSDKYRQKFFREILGDTQAKRVIPVHWDDFTQPLSKPLMPLKRLAGDLDEQLGVLVEYTNKTGKKMEMLPAWDRFVLFD